MEESSELIHTWIFQQCLGHSSPSVSNEAPITAVVTFIIQHPFWPYLSSFICFSVERTSPLGHNILRMETDSYL